MKQWFFFLLIFTGVVELSAVYKYYLIQQGKTWTDAQAYCKTIHIDLATIESEAILNQIQTELRWQLSSSAWIGLHKDMNRHTWHWSMGNQTVGSVVQWGSGAPGVSCCGAVIDNALYDIPCSRARPYICYDNTKTGTNQYIYYYIFKSWADARSYCRQYHTDLTSTRDSTELSIVSQKVVDILYFTWTGLFKDFWIWSDQGNSSIVPWMTGQPDNAATEENCGYLSNGQTGDAQCTDVMPFICYRIITGQQRSLSLKVQSDQDVNNPTVYADLLDLINQKLVELGMEDVKVTWRMQSNGGVFRKLNTEKNATLENFNQTCEILDF